MGRTRYVHATPIAAPAGAVFVWQARSGALERLTPPWERVDVETRYVLPFGPLGRLVAGGAVQRELRRMFASRHGVTKADVEVHAGRAGEPAMRLAVTGSRGLLGSALVPFLLTGGHQVIRLVRGSTRGSEEASWDPARGLAGPASFEGLDAVIHLAGENIAAARWTRERKAEIRRSRAEGTRRLCEGLARLSRPPKALVCASAIGYYGDRGDEILREDSPAGAGFLSEVCQLWESAAEPASQAGIRVVHMRFGMILTPAGGALRKMLVPFRLGLGGKMGNGGQYVSWIAVDDATFAIHHVLCNDSVRGPVNAVAPAPVTNAEFTRTLARVLSRPALATLPAFAARLAFGEMADALLLASQRVVPSRLQASGYRFQYPALEEALRHLLGRPR